MTDDIKAEPVAYLLSADGEPVQVSFQATYQHGFAGYTEGGLYTEAQLVEERRLAWNEAIEAAANDMASWFPPGTEGHHNYGAIAAIRALTKDSTHD